MGNNPIIRIDPDGRSFVGAYGMINNTGSASVDIFDGAGYTDRMRGVQYNSPPGMSGGGGGSRNSGKAMGDWMRSMHKKRKEGNRQNVNKKIKATQITETAETNPYKAAGSFYALASSLDPAQVHALHRGRDAATDLDYEITEVQTGTGVVAVFLLPGGAAMAGKFAIKSGRIIIQNAPKIYSSLSAAKNSLGNLGMHGYVLLESSVAAQGFAGIAQGLGEYYFQLPPGSLDHPFVITHISSETTKSFLFFLLNEQ